MMNSLIGVVNKLQDAFNSAGIEAAEAIQLPQIVVVGSQSTGKSSILESLVGHSILPRGNGMVTRCPIILQLTPLSDGNEALEKIKETYGKEEWCKILSQPNTIYTDFEEARGEIEKETTKLIGNNKNITDRPIVVKIFSKNILHLTVVDLPGSVKISSGNQPADIEEQIQNLILSYIQNPSSIILAVCQGNADIVTSESLKLAKIVDPAGERTLAVVTKFDLLEDTMVGHEILYGQILPVNLGIIGVVNRSQHDLANGLSIKDGQKKEEIFFKKNYPNLKDRTGSTYLGSTLSQILLSHIEKCLVPLEMRIQSLRIENEKKLKMLGTSVQPVNYFNTVADIVKRFADAFKDSIDGTSRNIETFNTAVSERLRIETSINLKEFLSKIDPIKGLSDDIIKSAMSYTRGAEHSFPNYESTFKDLVKKIIPQLREPSLTCANHVNKLLIDNVDVILNLPNIKPLHDRYPNLAKTIFKESKKYLNDRFEEAKIMIQNYVDVQSSFVVILEDNFIEKIKEMKTFEAQNSTTQSTSSENKQSSSVETKKNHYQVVRNLTQAYFDIVRRAFYEYLPKALFHSMVYNMVDNIQNHLLGLFYEADMQTFLMQESELIARDRFNSEETQKALEDATKIITDVQGMSFVKKEGKQC